MKARFAVCMLATLLAAATAFAASNLNLSKSNFYRLTYSSELASPTQAKAMLAELDRMGPADEAKLRQWLAANFKRLGIAGDRVRKIVVMPSGKAMKETGIILLTNPGDEAVAIATTVKSSKSNSSD
jgi:hypothetical protein